MYGFLSALPAVLGALGFVIFLILRSFGKGDPATLRIVDKLRAEHPERFTATTLSPQQLHDLLSRDQRLQKEVGKQDFALLGQTLRQQHVQALVVYVLCATLFIVGVILFIYQINRPDPTNITGIQIESTNADAGGVLVDLDALRVSWQAAGAPAEIRVYAENPDSGGRTRPIKARSVDGQVSLEREDYATLLVKRTFGSANRIRVIIQSDAEAFFSKEFALHVGLTVLAAAFDSKVKIAAMIDNRVVDGHAFEAKLVVPEKKAIEFLSRGGTIVGAQDYPLSDIALYDWTKGKLAYFGPGDARLVRYEIIHG